MINYTLHKLPEEFLIVSDEKPQENDLVYDSYDLLIYKLESFTSTNIHQKKLVAQQDQINFSFLSEDDCKKIERVEKSVIHFLNRKYRGTLVDDKRNLELVVEILKEYHQDFLSERRFTLKDMEYCYNTASRRGKMQEVGLEADLGFQNYIQSYHNNSWKIELEMKEITDGTLTMGDWDKNNITPKFTNGKVKILKLL